MTKLLILAVLIFNFFLSCIFSQPESEWKEVKTSRFSMHYTTDDQPYLKTYMNMVDEGVSRVESFFHRPFPSFFRVNIYSNRSMLDSVWRIDWKMPDYTSECWMVASGIADKIDMISPRNWDTESCEHHFGDTLAVRQLIAHELVHVYHGQFNVSHDFSVTENIDWFVEGLAAFISGQCDTSRLATVKAAIQKHEEPKHLSEFWTGKLRYWNSGSMVAFLYQRYGRDKLFELLKYNKNTDILKSLTISEEQLVNDWKDWL